MTNANETGPASPTPFAGDWSDRRRLDPCIIVLFGATGDLTHRKLIPALFEQARSSHLPANFAIVGVARRPLTDEQFRASLTESLAAHVDDFRPEEPFTERFLGAIRYHQAPFEEPEGYESLRRRLEEIDVAEGTLGNRLFYLSVAPGQFAPIARALGNHGLISRRPQHGRWARVVVEKPFGRDLESAARLNRDLQEVLDESQIYRIDHYLGKETVQNILAFRFGNSAFEPLWNQRYIDHVQITVSETLGVEGRGPYYDRAGAVRDMVQNHMMQLLSLVAMEPPWSLDADAVRDEKVKVLRALRSMSPEDVRQGTVRAQYTAGYRLGERVPGYREEDRVPADSSTETYAAMRLHVDNWRWAGTPFILRHGKRLPRRVTEIAIQFREPPVSLFGIPDGPSAAARTAPNLLVLNIQPEEGISLSFSAKEPGGSARTRPVKMDFLYGGSFGTAPPEAYERLLVDAIAGDATLFIRHDEVEASWRFMDDVLSVWEADGPRGLTTYEAGSAGPAEADALFAGTRGSWRRL